MINKHIEKNRHEKIAIELVEHSPAIIKMKVKALQKSDIDNFSVEVLREVVFEHAHRIRTLFTMNRKDQIKANENFTKNISWRYGWDRFLRALDSMENSINKKQPNEIGVKGFATFLYHSTGFNAPGKNDKIKWEKVLKEYGFDSTFSPLSIGKTYNDMTKESNRIDPGSNKNLIDALKAFEQFPDDQGLQKLKADIRKQKKGTVPK